MSQTAALIATAALLLSAQIESGETALFTGDVKPVLYVSDAESGAEFFRDSLGFTFQGFTNGTDGTPYYAEMAAGDLKFGLHEAMSDRQAQRVGQARVYFRVVDLERQVARLAARGIGGDIIRADWMDMCIVPDPDGNEIVFAETDPDRHAIDPW